MEERGRKPRNNYSAAACWRSEGDKDDKAVTQEDATSLLSSPCASRQRPVRHALTPPAIFLWLSAGGARCGVTATTHTSDVDPDNFDCKDWSAALVSRRASSGGRNASQQVRLTTQWGLQRPRAGAVSSLSVRARALVLCVGVWLIRGDRPARIWGNRERGGRREKRPNSPVRVVEQESRGGSANRTSHFAEGMRSRDGRAW